MLRKSGTSEVFEPYTVGVGERTKNLLEITAKSQTINGITFTVDKQAGTITINGQVKSSANTAQIDLFPRQLIDSSLNGLILSEPASPTIPDYALRTSIAYYDASVNFISEQNINSGNPNPIVVSVPSNAYSYKIYVYVKKSAGTFRNLVIKPMLRPANTTSDFIPHGYQIPLITMDAKTAEYVYKTDVFIGDSPLTEGESVSKSSTGLDIKTITIGADDYPNRLITSLSNKPEMTIKYKTKGGN